MHNYFHGKGVFTRELFEIYFLLALKKLSFSMVGIFLPLYLWQELGYSLNETLFFFIFWTLVFGILLFVATKVVSKYGTKHSMIFSVPLSIIGMILLVLLPQYPALFYVASFFMGADLAFFWMGFHIDAAIQGKKKSAGKESAIITLLGVLPTVIGPLIGGLLLLYFDFTTLFILALLLSSVSFIPLLFSKEVYAKTHYSIRYFFKREHTKYFFAFFAQGAHSSTGAVIWPLFIFFILGGYFSMGIYGTIATLAIAVFGLVIGEWSDEGKKTFMIRVLGFFYTITSYLRVFVSSILEVFALGSLVGVSRVGVGIPLLAKAYTRAKKEHEVAGFILFRELSIRLGQLFILLVVFFVGTLESAFIVAAVLSLTFVFFGSKLLS